MVGVSAGAGTGAGAAAGAAGGGVCGAGAGAGAAFFLLLLPGLAAPFAGTAAQTFSTQSSSPGQSTSRTQVTTGCGSTQARFTQMREPLHSVSLAQPPPSCAAAAPASAHTVAQRAASAAPHCVGWTSARFGTSTGYG